MRRRLLGLSGIKAVFKDDHLSLATKRSVYMVCVLSVFLYGCETWVLLRRDMNGFHHRCICTVLGITITRGSGTSILFLYFQCFGLGAVQEVGTSVFKL